MKFSYRVKNASREDVIEYLRQQGFHVGSCVTNKAIIDGDLVSIGTYIKVEAENTPETLQFILRDTEGNIIYGNPS